MTLFYTNTNRMHCFLMIAICFIFGPYTLRAQEMTCTVIDQHGVAVSDVQIGIKNKDFTTQTSLEGISSFKIAPGDVLTFSHSEYLYKEVKLNEVSDKTVVVRLTEKNVKGNTLDVAYDVVDKNSYLGSASTIYTNRINKTSGITIIPSLAGNLGGLYVKQNRGINENRTSANTSNDIFMGNRINVGSELSDNTQFNLSARGYSPVVLIDGVQRELFSIDPEAIESVSLQKDALSSIMMGMRSSRGVLVITTKKPTEGFQISFTGKYGIQEPMKIPKPVSAYQWAYLVNEAMTNDGKPTYFTQDDFMKFRDGTNPYTHPDVNWYDQLLNSNAPTKSYNLNASGGNKVAQFYINLGYMDEEGLFKELSSNPYKTNQNYKRYQVTSKVDVNVTNDLKAGITIMGRMEDGNQPGAVTSTILTDIYRTPNGAYPIFNPSKMYENGGNSSFTNNLMSMTTNSGYRTTNARDGVGTITLDYNMGWLLKGLSAKAMGSVSSQSLISMNRSKRVPVYQYIPAVTPGGEPSYAQFGSRSSQSNSFISVYSYNRMYGQISLNYQTEIDKHAIGGELFADMQQVLISYNLPRYIANIIPKLKYNYDSKYFAEATLSRSYFNQYNPKYCWGTFFALGLGWDITREGFMPDLTWLDQLKLRGVYGLTGNGIDNAGYFDWRHAYRHANNSGYNLGTNASTGHIAEELNNLLPNPRLSWEKAHKINIGFDASMMNKHLQFSFDYYNDRYFDLLQEKGKSIQLIGLSYSNENIGKANYNGVELEVSYNNHVGNLNYFVSANWNNQGSKVVFMDEQYVQEEYNRITGTPVGAWFGLEADGFYSSNAEIENSAKIQGFTIRPGDIKYVDQNGDGVINIYDRKLIGNDKRVKFFGFNLGLEFRGLEFSTQFQGVYDRDIYLRDAGDVFIVGLQSAGQTYSQLYEHSLNRWTPETAATATFPRLIAGGASYNTNPNGWRSSFWVRSGDFIRMKNINLGYTLPDVVSKNLLGGVRVKFFVEGNNLLTMSACNLVDPEVIDFRNYPMMKGFNAGVNIKF